MVGAGLTLKNLIIDSLDSILETSNGINEFDEVFYSPKCMHSRINCCYFDEDTNSFNDNPEDEYSCSFVELTILDPTPENC